MYRRLSAALTCTLVATGTLTATAQNAAAVEELPSRVVLYDGAGDVWTYGLNGSQNPPAMTSFPPADVMRAVIKHGPDALRLRMRFADLDKVGRQAYRVDILTSKARYDGYFAAVVAGPDSRQGRHFLELDSSVRCPGFTHEIDYVTDVVTMRIPRRCLGRPRWVKVHLDNALWTGDSDHPDSAYEDNPHGHNAYTEAFTGRLYQG